MSSSSIKAHPHIPHIRHFLKECDRDNYLAILFGKEAIREDLWALYAFNGELAKIPHIVQEPMLGQIRLQWWRDQILEACTPDYSLSGHPVADGLKAVISKYQLKPDLFYALIDVREQDLAQRAFETAQQFADYHDQIWGNLYRLSFQISVFPNEASTKIRLDDPVFHYAAQITGMGRFLAFSNAQSLAEHMSISLDSLQGQKTLAAQDDQFIEALPLYKALLKAQHSEKQKKLCHRLKALPLLDSSLFLVVALSKNYLDKWQSQQNSPVHNGLQLNPLTVFFRLWRAKRIGLIPVLIRDLAF